MTPERLAHLQERMITVGLSSKNPDLLKHDAYFIDVIGSGAGFAYVAEEILKDFKSAHLPYPNLKVITMNKIDINDTDSRNNRIAKTNADQNGHTTLYFPSIKDTHFETDSIEVYIAGHSVLDMLPSKEYRGFPEYNPFYWQKEFDKRLTQGHTPQMKALLEYFDENTKKLMSEDASGSNRLTLH